MSDQVPHKSITIAGHILALHGVSADDSYWRGLHDDYEPDFTEVVERFVHPEAVCLDIGANIGLKTLILARHCTEGEVVAVEAGKTVANRLALNIASNGITNARVLHAAVGDRNGFTVFEEASAWGHVAAFGNAVPAVTIENIVGEFRLQRLDFIKIDVEGGELPILKSSLALINRYESLVHVEFNSLTSLVWGNTNPREFIEWVCSRFKHVHAINRSRPDAPLLSPVVADNGCQAILHRNLVDDGCVTDLLMTNAVHRLHPTAANLERQLARSRQRESELASAVQQARTEIAQLHADLELHRETIRAHASFPSVSMESHSRVIREVEQVRAELAGARAWVAPEVALYREAAAHRDAMLTSTSWRVTAALRWAGVAWRRRQVR